MTTETLRGIAALALVFCLAGCGGGAGIAALIAGVGSGGTGVIAGTITGFGSVIVEGTRYPDSTASYDLTGESAGTLPLSRTLVRMGQQAEVETDAGGNATAVHIYPEVIGIVSAIGTANTLTVAGTRVLANSADPALPLTVYGGYAQFSDIQGGDRIEVHGLPRTDGAGPYVAASRIELKPGTCSGGCAVRVGGTISQLNSSSFTLGGLKVNYGGSTVITPTGQSLANGERVSVFSSAPLSGTNLTATSIKIRKLSTAIGDLRLTGAVSDYVSNASFTVAGVTVNAASATLSPGSLILANGVSLIVRGSFDQATNKLVATSITQYRSDSVQAELTGTVTNFVSVANFKVRGTLVNASAAAFSAGSATGLQNNVYVKIRGTVANNAVSAATVQFDSESSGSVDDLSGVVSGFTSATQAFTITPDNRATPVPAILAATPFYVGGTGADLGNGKYVTVNASLVNGQWLVNTVTFMLGTQSSGGGSSGATSTELEGIANNFNQAAGTFSLNGITVKFDTARITGNGTLGKGVRVQVYGTLSGAILTASRIEIDD
ncbi:MAG: DUF5666 domain-containing protein [Rhodocyclales bacterium]|nr:DUF5666 domain-containing protein [Rhodocyclales bacterium]